MGGRLGGEGVRSIDDAVARRVDRDRDGNGEFSGTNADNFFYLTDVMFSVRAIVDGAGRLHTRLDYTPYGVAMHGFAADVNGDGVVNFIDIPAFSAVYNNGTALRPGQAGYDPDADLAGSGAMNFFDYSAFITRLGQYTDNGTNPTFNAGWIDNPSDTNGPDNSVGYDGYWFDLAGATEATSSGLYMVRHRVYDPRLGRWLQRDPAGYVDGSSLYQYAVARPTVFSDPSGLTPNCSKCSPWAPSGTQQFYVKSAKKTGRPLMPRACVCEIVMADFYERECPLDACNTAYLLGVGIIGCATQYTHRTSRKFRVTSILPLENCRSVCQDLANKTWSSDFIGSEKPSPPIDETVVIHRMHDGRVDSSYDELKLLMPGGLLPRNRWQLFKEIYDWVWSDDRL